MLYNLVEDKNLKYISKLVRSIHKREFHGGPVVKTLHSHCRGPGFDPWLEN